jgi:hypothetical protein
VTIHAGRSPAELGLDFPMSVPGPWGLAAMGLLSAETYAEFTAKTGDDDCMPRAGSDVFAFVGMAVVLGADWEVLYRGFPMLVLTPLTGAPGVRPAAGSGPLAAKKGQGTRLAGALP